MVTVPISAPYTHTARGVTGEVAMSVAMNRAPSTRPPETPRAVWVNGALIGTVTIVIRYYGGLSEGVMYAILFGNTAAPLLDKYLQPKVFGAKPK